MTTWSEVNSKDMNLFKYKYKEIIEIPKSIEYLVLTNAPIFVPFLAC